MKGCLLFLLWIGCITAGGIVGFALGYVIWQLGFELLGGATAMVSGVIGGTAAFFGLYTWNDRRQTQAAHKRKNKAQQYK